MKKFFKIVLIVLAVLIGLLVLLVACSDSDTESGKGKSGTKSEIKSKGPLAEKDYEKMYTDPKKYKGYEVTVRGKVFSEPEKDEDGVYFQMYGDPENAEKNTMVAADTSLKIKSEQYVEVKGIVVDEFSGENAFGGEISAAGIRAESVKEISYIDAMAPTKKTIELNKVVDQHGLKVELQKVELADNQTRVFVKITNKTNVNATFFDSGSKLVVGNKQLETEYLDSEESGLAEVQSDILPGIETEGVMIYPAVESGTTSMNLLIDASNDNYDIDFAPYTFEIPVK
ncbi:hypothetical protein [Exiguobacterium sp. MH3]|uniref:hypothetical protein n=1 Tax=Exiguobacterium sp. MH3 TaxID=1399115 RepID=UPI0003C3C130|nr:hypothetical protein [Exiguobacterium sp. MH3]AHA30805.1 hypothetical protein U719_14430 [Exiguobacterium sp. MH3]